ncbi:MAG TPA: PAS domain-containing protein [Burkholderiales bacterium]|nr:PAS domain-containing protein [Burkholderiales bacterium]
MAVKLLLQELPGMAPATPWDVSWEDDLPVMLWRARPDMACEFANRAWLAFTGYRGEDAQGHGWSRVVHPEDLARWLDTCVRAFDARAPYEIEYRMRRHDGAYRWVLERGAPREADGAFAGYLGLCIDIEERKRSAAATAGALERERRLRAVTDEASHAKDRLFANLLAELHAPTEAIAAWSACLREELPPEARAGDALEAIESATRAQARVISNLQEFAGARGAPLGRPLDVSLLTGVRVLVVEEDAQAREVLLKVLRMAGAEACAVPDSAHALPALEDWRPDVLLSDPGVGDDGYLLLRARPAPQRGIAFGYDAQLAKPVEPVALLATVARLVRPATA